MSRRKEAGSGGGAAAAGGFSFQALIGARIAVRLLAGSSVGAVLGLQASDGAESLRFETEHPVDDLLVATTDSGDVFVQAKTSLSFSSSPTSQLYSVINQFVQQWLGSCDDNDDDASTIGRLVLAVSARAPRTIRHYLREIVDEARNVEELSDLENSPRIQSRKRYLGTLLLHVRRAFQTHRGSAPSDAMVIGLLQLIHVLSASEEIHSPEYDSDRATLEREVVRDGVDGAAAFSALTEICLQFCSQRSGGNARVFRVKLAERGIECASPPSYIEDVEKLKRETRRSLERESSRQEIVLNSESALATRPCQAELLDRLSSGSAFVSGEPGAGKTGLLVSVANQWIDQERPVVFLSVDRFPVTTSDDLRTSLGLAHPLVEVLSNWDGIESALLVVDALDAARGSAAEQVFARLIEDVAEECSDSWRICISIRSFDLANSARYGELSHLFESVLVGELDDDELTQLADKSSQIAAVLETGSEDSRALLRNPFNLQLAMDVVELAGSANVVLGLKNQAALIAAYWDLRLPDIAERSAVGQIAKNMVTESRLVADYSEMTQQLGAAILNRCLRRGVVVNDQGDLWLRFRHHILFDYAAAMTIFGKSDSALPVEPILRESGQGLTLAPALRFRLQRLWASDESRLQFWEAVSLISGRSTVDPVARACAARTVVELAREQNDTVGALNFYATRASTVHQAILEICQEVRIGLKSGTASEETWASFARDVLDQWTTESLYPVRLILVTLAECDELTPVALAATAEAGLQFFDRVFAPDSRGEYRGESQHAISVLMRTFSQVPDEAKTRLRTLFRPERTDAHAHQDIPTLCGCLEHVIPVDPSFVAEIFTSVFAVESPSAETTSLGGSQILPLRSTAKQDFELCFWQLGEVFPVLWDASPADATIAAIGAIRGHLASEERLEDCESWSFTAAGETMTLTADRSFIWDSDPDGDLYGRRAGPVLKAFTEKLLRGGDDEVLRAARTLSQSSPPALLWARLFAAATARLELLGSELWPFACQAAFYECEDSRHDAVGFLGAIWSSLGLDDKERFEQELFERTSERVQPFILSVLPTTELVTERVRALREQLDAAEEIRRPARSSIIISSGEYDWAREHGVDVDRPPNSTLREAVSAFQERIPRDQEEFDALGAEHAIAVLENSIVEAEAANVDWRVSLEAVNELARGCSTIALRADLESHGEIGVLVRRVLLDISRHENPEPQTVGDLDGGLMAWSSPAPRIEAAQGLIRLSRHEWFLNEEVRERLRDLAIDPVPTVRLQVAQQLNALWNSDREYMWTLIEYLAVEEQHWGVLKFFVSSTLRALLDVAPAEVCRLSQLLAERASAAAGENRDETLRAAASVLAVLWLWRGWEPAGVALHSWLDRLAEIRIPTTRAITVSREGLSIGLKRGGGTEDDVQIRSRCQSFVKRATNHGAVLLGAARDSGDPPQPGSENAALVLDVAVRQVYFASGAFDRKRNRKEAPLETLADKERYLREVAPILENAARAGIVHTLHYILETLEFLLPSSPARAFDIALMAMLDGAEGGAYAFEQMGASLFARMARVVIADHREVLNDPRRRARLLDVLERFLQRGSEEARQLLHELPGALR